MIPGLITMIHVQAAGTVTHPDVRMVTITLMAVIVKGVVDMEIIAVLLTIIIASQWRRGVPKTAGLQHASETDQV